jgi:hypothetical protein
MSSLSYDHIQPCILCKYKIIFIRISVHTPHMNVLHVSSACACLPVVDYEYMDDTSRTVVGWRLGASVGSRTVTENAMKDIPLLENEII